MAWTDPKTWVASAILTAAELNTHLRDNLKAIGDPWAAYVPTWDAASTSPVLNNGTLVGAYAQAGNLVHFRIELTIGSSTTDGTGSYVLSLPVAPASGARCAIAVAAYYDASSADNYGLTAYHSVSFPGYVALAGGDGSRWSHLAPVSPATGDIISVCGTYEAA